MINLIKEDRILKRHQISSLLKESLINDICERSLECLELKNTPAVRKLEITKINVPSSFFSNSKTTNSGQLDLHE